MRTATVAKLSLTALVGLGSLFGTANVAQAGPGPVIKAGPATTTTTVKPMQGDLIEVPYCDAHLCIEATPVDPTPDPPKPGDLPIALPDPDDGPDDKLGPNGNDPDPEPGCPENVLCDELAQPEPECNVTHGCDEGGTGGGDGGSDGETTDGGADGGSDGGTDGVTSDGGDTDGGSTGGGPLPKTGGDIATILGVGLGLTGVGAAARKLGRRHS